MYERLRIGKHTVHLTLQAGTDSCFFFFLEMDLMRN